MIISGLILLILSNVSDKVVEQINTHINIDSYPDEHKA